MQVGFENQLIIFKFHKWKAFYHEHKITVTIWLLFFVSVAIRTFFASGMKLLSTYEDEVMYYGVAENLARNHSFSVYYLPCFRMDRVVYSILISPAFLANTREVQFLMIAFINAIILSSGLMPTYLLSKAILENKYWALFVGVLYVFMPDMAYTGTFMSDLCFLPIALWVFYFAYRVLNWNELSQMERWKYGILFIITSVLACFTKQAGILFVPAFFGAFLFCSIDDSKHNNHPFSKKWVLLLVAIVIFCILTLYLGSKFIHIRAWLIISKVLEIVFEKPLEYLAFTGYSTSQMIIAGGIFPLVLPYVYRKQYDKKGKKWFVYVSMVTLFVLLAESYTQTSGLYSIRRIHLRYVLFLWIPYLILFLKIIRQDELVWNRSVKIGWGILLVWTASLIYWNRGVEYGSYVDYTMLYFAENWDHHWSIYSIVTCAFVLLSFYLFIRKQWKSFTILFFVIWFMVQGYNNYMATNVISTNYAANMEEYKEVSRIEKFIASHSDDTFLLLMMSDKKAIPVRRWSDTYLNYPNVKTTFYEEYLENENDDGSGYDISEHPFRAYQYLGNFYEETQYDYIIVPTYTDSCVDSSKGRLLESISGSQFMVYEIMDSSNLPTILSFKYIQPGYNYFSVGLEIFASQFETDGQMYFCSQGKQPGYVMYGPYRTLPPGEYIVTIHFSDESGTEGTFIGEADVNSSSTQLVENSTVLWSGDNSATFSFSSEEDIELFETRLYAEVPGIRAHGVDIIYTPLEEN